MLCGKEPGLRKREPWVLTQAIHSRVTSGKCIFCSMGLISLGSFPPYLIRYCEKSLSRFEKKRPSWMSRYECFSNWNKQQIKHNRWETTELKYACSVVQSSPTLCNAMDCSPPGSSVHGEIYVVIFKNIFFWLCMWDLSSPTKGGTSASCSVSVDS